MARKCKHEPKNQQEYLLIEGEVKKRVVDKLIKRGAKKEISKVTGISEQVVDFVLKKLKKEGLFTGIAKVYRKSKPKVSKKSKEKFFKFKNILPQDLILSWMGIKRTNPKCKTPFFWAREMKLLKNLCEKYPQDFIENLKFEFPIDSLVVLASNYHKNFIKKKYLEYRFKPREYKKTKVGTKTVAKKLNTKKKKNIRNFLNNGKK